MTKTLTEQLKNGTLKDGLYYIKDNDNILIGLRNSLTMIRLIDDGCPSFEVLAPVSSYDEDKKLKDQIADLSKKVHILNEANMKLENELGQLADLSKKVELLKKQLEIAIRALKEINEKYRFTVAQEVVYKALKEINEVVKDDKGN